MATTRRGFLKMSGGITAAASLSQLSMMNAFAQTASDYKALVCVFMFGGNDGHATLVPQSAAQYQAYQNIRGSLALPDANASLLPVSAKDGTPYALNSGLTALAPLWAQGNLASVVNTGMLVQPVTRAQYMAKAAPVPTNLFSHVDQVTQMQAANPHGAAGTGWGGRVADALQTMNAASRFPPAISLQQSALFCSGSAVQSASLIPGFDLSRNGMDAYPATAAAAKVKALQEILTFDSGLTLVQAANRVQQDANTLNGLLKGLTNSTPLSTPFPSTDIGGQLKQVAQIIQLRASTGIKRQVFFVSLGSFDTHSGGNWTQWDLLRQLSESLSAFYSATQEMGVANQVTAFTQSDFGRTLQPSGTGTDHGWGNHQFVLGGAVKGGDIYGKFPTLALGGPDDTDSRGIMIPTTSIDQYAATMAKWFGVAPAALAQIFPNLANFAKPDLGFMG